MFRRIDAKRSVKDAGGAGGEEPCTDIGLSSYDPTLLSITKGT